MNKKTSRMLAIVAKKHNVELKKLKAMYKSTPRNNRNALKIFLQS